MDKFESILGPIANTLNQNKVLQAISRGLLTLMPALMIGAIGTLVQQIPVPAYQSFIQSTGIYSTAQLFVNVTTNMFALYAAFSITYSYTNNKGYDGFSAGVLALIAFLIVTPLETVGEGWFAVTNLPLSWLGSKGLFTAMIVSIVTAVIYSKFMEKDFTIKLPESVPPFISKSFSGIIPGIFIAVVFGIIVTLTKLTSYGDLHNLIYQLIGTPLNNLGGSIWTAMFIYMLSGICWFFGIHGIAVIGVMIPIWMGGDLMNVGMVSAGALPTNIVTFNWLNAVQNMGGAGATLGLVTLFLFRAKSSRYKSISKLAIVPSLFGINEPVVFGLPVVLNPILFVPFVFLPVILIGLSYVLVVIGILPVGNGVALGTTIPVVSAFMIGGWRYAVWNVIEFAISIVVYYPFFKILDKQAVSEESN